MSGSCDESVCGCVLLFLPFYMCSYVAEMGKES